MAKVERKFTPEQQAELERLLRGFAEGLDSFAEEAQRLLRPRVQLPESFGQSPRKRHAPKSEPAIAVLKDLYRPNGRPSREAVPDAALKRAYHEECDRRGIHKNDRVSDTQLLRCAGRKK